MPATETRHDRRHFAAFGSVCAAVSLGITATGVVRGGAFYSPDLVAVPAFVALAAVADRRRLSRADLHVVLALVVFSLLWLGRAVLADTTSRAASLSAAAIAFGATYATARRTRSLADQLLAFRALVLVGALVAFVSIALWSTNTAPWGLPFDGVWRLSGPFAYPNAAGLFFALAFIANLAHNERTWRERALSGVIILTALVVTASRGAFLSLLAGLVVMGPRSYAIASKGRRVFVAVTGAAAVCAAVYVASLTFGLVGEAGAHSATASMDDRVAEWSAAARQGGSSPIIGKGPEQDLHIHNFRGDAVARYAHNEPLQIFAGLGFVGVAALAAIVGALVTAQSDEDGPSGRVAPAALVVVAIGGLLDFSWHFVGLMAYAGWLAGLDDAPVTGSARRDRLLGGSR